MTLSPFQRWIQGLPPCRSPRSLPICCDDNAGTCDHRVDQAEVRERAAIGEQAASFAEHQRVDLQYVLVDQIASHQRLDQHAAAEDHQGLIMLL